MLERPRAVLWSGVLCLAALTACGSADDVAEPVPTTRSSPFAVSRLPNGYVLTAGGTGRATQDWGSDSFGTVEPVTVLAPKGAGAGSPKVVTVSVTGYEGYEGGLEQASLGADARAFEVDGHDALFVPATTGADGPEPADLVVDRGDDLAVRVTAASGSRDQLVAIERSVEPDRDHIRAPAVPDPPAGLRVIGSVDADVLIALGAGESDARVPGTRTAHALVWKAAPDDSSDSSDGSDDDGQRATVLTLPGTAVDLPALMATSVLEELPGAPKASSLSVDGRPGVLLQDDDGADVERSLVTRTAWGDLLVVSSSGSDPLTADQLVAVAATTRQVDQAAWQEQLDRIGD